MYFSADKLFNTDKIDKSHKSQRKLNLMQRDTVTQYIKNLEKLYKHHRVLEKLVKLGIKLSKVMSTEHKSVGINWMPRD